MCTICSHLLWHLEMNSKHCQSALVKHRGSLIIFDSSPLSNVLALCKLLLLQRWMPPVLTRWLFLFYLSDPIEVCLKYVQLAGISCRFLLDYQVKICFLKGPCKYNLLWLLLLSNSKTTCLSFKVKEHSDSIHHPLPCSFQWVPHPDTPLRQKDNLFGVTTFHIAKYNLMPLKACQVLEPTKCTHKLAFGQVFEVPASPRIPARWQLASLNAL